MSKSAKSSVIEVDGIEYCWSVRHWPLYTKTFGYKGLSVLVEPKISPCRSLLLEFPFNRKNLGSSAHRWRPVISRCHLTEYIRAAIQKGWDSESRGKEFVYHVPEEAESNRRQQEMK